MQKKFVVMLAAAMLMAIPAVGVAGMAASNTVNSAAIVDGEVKTADIANLAVTTAKIANGAVTANQIAAGAVTASQLASGSVTDAKIVGPISGSKLGAHAHVASDVVGVLNATQLPVGSTAGTVAAGNHNHDTLYQQKYAKVAVVAQSGGSYTDPVAAMNNLATWCGTPSAANPCLVKIMPGVYNLSAATSVNMSSFVDLEGSGESVTRISGSALGVVSANGVTNAEIRGITVESLGGDQSVALSVTGSNIKASNATFNASNGVAGNTLNTSVRAYGSTINLNHITAEVVVNGPCAESHNLYIHDGSTANVADSNFHINNGYGLHVENNCVLNFKNSTATSDYGTTILTNFGSTSNIINSKLASPGWCAYSYSGRTNIVNSQLSTPDGTVMALSSGATAAYIGVYDANFTKITSANIYNVSGYPMPPIQ